VFALDNDYSFGILQSSLHWVWFTERCSTLKSDPRYTSNTVFDSFPWPQNPSVSVVKKVAVAAVSLRQKRRELRQKHRLSFRDLYRSLELPGDHALKAVHGELDRAVREAYGLDANDEPFGFLPDLNFALAQSEADGNVIQAAGLPSFINDKAAYVTTDSISMQ
jgi:hypothetical protein